MRLRGGGAGPEENSEVTGRDSTSLPRTWNRAQGVALFAALWLTIGGCTATPIHSGPQVAASKEQPAGAKSETGGTVSEDPHHKAPAALYHKVRAGEKLKDIAATYGTTPELLLKANHRLETDDALQPGQDLYIPASR